MRLCHISLEILHNFSLVKCASRDFHELRFSLRSLFFKESSFEPGSSPWEGEILTTILLALITLYYINLYKLRFLFLFMDDYNPVIEAAEYFIRAGCLVFDAQDKEISLERIENKNANLGNKLGIATRPFLSYFSNRFRPKEPSAEMEIGAMGFDVKISKKRGARKIASLAGRLSGIWDCFWQCRGVDELYSPPIISGSFSNKQD